VTITDNTEIDTSGECANRVLKDLRGIYVTNVSVHGCFHPSLRHYGENPFTKGAGGPCLYEHGDYGRFIR
jgi:hypothetical protein